MNWRVIRNGDELASLLFADLISTCDLSQNAFHQASWLGLIVVAGAAAATAVARVAYLEVKLASSAVGICSTPNAATTTTLAWSSDLTAKAPPKVLPAMPSGMERAALAPKFWYSTTLANYD